MLLLIATAGVLLAALGAPAARPRTSAPQAPGAAASANAGRVSPRALESLPGGAAGVAESAQGPYRLGEVLVGFRSGVSAARELAIEHAAGAQAAMRLGPPIKPLGHGRTTGQEYLAPLELRVPDAQVLGAVQRLKRYSEVAYAEPNYLQVGAATPNDSGFAKQWGSENTGQPIPTQSIPEEKEGPAEKGTAGADDRANLAWSQITTGSNKIVIGEVDTGVAYNHPDLEANIWSNPGGINGCAKGTHGENVLAKNCNPIDEDSAYNGHGTHVAGILGAVGNNGIGVAGMNWQTTILPVRWMNSASAGVTSDLVASLQWLIAAKQAGVNLRVVNDSDVFPGKTGSEALKNAIESLGTNNVLFVTAAGNTGQNNNEEAVQRFPCSYDLANELCVTATNNKDELPSWANYGSKTVQLAAPGQSIYSTLRGNSYGYLSGGSMASPQVAGAAALILSANEKMSTAELKTDLEKNVDKLPSLEGKVITGGRLDVCKALPGCTPPPPPPIEETVGPTTPGEKEDNFASERKRVNRYAFPTSSVTRLNVYLKPTNTAGQQVMKGVIYSDASGKPETLLGVSEQLTFKHENAAGYYALTFKTPVNLSAGNYWIGVTTGPTNGVAGFKWNSVTNARDYNANAYSSGPTNPFGSVTTDSEQMSLYASIVGAPVNTAVPTISGEARQEKSLTEVHGSWTNEPTSFSYKWQQCDSSGNNCTIILGATSQTYTLLAGDVGHTIRAQETASNAKGSGSPAISAATAVVVPLAPTIVKAPTISGEARQAQPLTEVHGEWTNSPTGFTYQWLQCNSEGTLASCTSISGATKQTYEPVAGDVGHKLRVQETASNAGGPGAPATSEPTAVVLPAVPTIVKAPTISGEARQGKTLTESHGEWTNSPTSYAYQWVQCNSEGTLASCTPISGATKQTYEPVLGDVGHKLRVQETASNAGGPSAPASSEPTAVILPAVPVNELPPTITGTAQQAKTLTEVHGTWSNSPTGYAYQWLQCNSEGTLATCTPISGATKQTYEALAGDVGHRLRVQETASNAGGPGAAATSEPTAVVTPPVPTIVKAPTISGTAQQGKTLTEAHGEWTNSPTSFTYQWLQCNSEGTLASCTPISGATKQTYEPVLGDVGHRLRVQETASNAAGPSEPATSEPTPVTLPAVPVNELPPTITGTAQQGKTLTEVHGTWSNSPTGYAYQWLQCNGEGTLATCAPISGATKQTYEAVAGDVGHRLRVQETASNAGGPGAAATSEPTAVVVGPIPVNIKPPEIIDPAQQGQTLTEAHGEWTNNPTGYTYQWLQCNSEGTLSSCTPISGATAQVYTPGSGDVGHRIRVEETASNAAGPSAPATSAPTPVVTPPPPKNSLPPTITGTAQQGKTLTEVHGTWSNSPTGYAYQWLQCNSEGTLASCTSISGATNQTYEAVAGDIGHKLRVQETASNAGGSGSPATSEPTAVVTPPVPTILKPPTISGEARQAKPLTEAHGEWTNNPTSYAYQWLQCNNEGTLASCTPISGATKQTYEPVAGDVGHKLRVQETASNAGGPSAPAPSEATAVVLPPPPVNEKLPTISGSAQQEKTLTEVHGTWSNNPTGFTYQWLQCEPTGLGCLPIAGATKQTYEPVAVDVGHTLRVQETASNAGGSGSPATSEPTAVVTPPVPTIVKAPTISGTAQQGKTLTEGHGEWTNNPTSYAYQWLQCNSEGTLASCTPISGASKQTYEPVAGDVGHKLRVQETASNAGGPSAPATSEATAVVVPPVPAIVKVPTISGIAQQAKALTEAHGEWTNSPTSYTYQWLQCNSEGTLASCTPISGATKQTYEVTPGDVGHKLRVQETASNAGGPSESPATSEATAVVVPPVPVNKTPPTVTGTAKQGQTLTDVHGEWTNEPTSFSYQWLQCNSEGTLASCTPISGATKQTYEVAPGDVGHRLRVEEIASDAGGPSAPATSEATAVALPAAPANTGLPTISGTAQQEKTLTEAHGTWTNSPTSFTYQWLQCNSEGTLASCTPISGASKQTYEPVAGDVGHKLRVQETASNAGGPSESPATSEPTAVVLPPVPVNTGLPTITGTAQQEKTLTEAHGTWTNSPTSYAYQWLQCNSEGTLASCTPISGASKQTYEPVAGDVGHKLRVQETASNAGGPSAPATSEATAAVVPPVPTIVKAPTISGEARPGKTLTEGHGEWTNGPTSFTYQWLQCEPTGLGCLPIAGATKQTYEPMPVDVGHTLRVQETASNAGGSGSPATSEPTAVVAAPVPISKTPPTITGSAQQEKTLTEHHGEWTNEPTGFTYQWLQCNSEGTLASCASISGATSQTYSPVAGDVGHKLRVQETATNSSGPSAPATSEPTAVVLPAVAANTGLPTISGTVQQEKTLTEAHGTWTNSPTSFTYQWLQCNSEGTLAGCTPISGATNQTYSPVAGDVGHKLRVQETASNAGGSSESPATSEATAVVLPAVPASTGLPTIGGTAQQEKTLTEAHGTWTNSPTSFTYQWLQCNSEGTLASCTPISGATKQTYEPVAGDVGHKLRVQETASNAGGPSASPATSEATAVVLPAVPASTGLPTISGTAQQEKTLTEAHGTWTNSPTGFTYQWLQCNSEGTPASCTPISGATKQTYEPVAGDVGHKLRVQETASNAGGPSAPATSEATAVVVPPPPVNEKPPTITGKAQQGQTLTELNGSWTNNPTGYSYQWMQCEALGNGCLAIAGATKQTYVPGIADEGHTIKVQEVASNAGGAGTPATSEPTGIVIPEGGVPSNETPPTITGKAQQGQTLTEQSGSWTREPTSFTYRWLQCNSEGTLASCTIISGATKQTYEVTPGDVGHTIRVQEEAGNTFGTSNPATSEPTAVVLPLPPSNASPPTITGEARQGQTLTEHHGEWTNVPTSYGYQWLQCNASNACTPISGATKQTYEVAAGDVGHTIKVQETASNAGGSGEATSAATGTVLPLPPTNTGLPTVEGKAQQGQTLTEAHGTWTNSPTSFTYQWLQCNSEGTLASCTSISGATKQTYEAVVGDIGHKLRVQETASNAGGTSESPAISEATAVVLSPIPINKTLPTITGKAQQGQTLTEVHGEWTNEPTSFTYQWLQCNSEGTIASCTSISGATKQAYEAAVGDIGHRLRVQETASNAAGPSSPAISEATAVVVPPVPASVSAPWISGTAQQLQTLTEHNGTWTNNPTTFTYQWLQCNGEGTTASCTPISGATKQTYEPLAGDIGHRLRVQETASNAAGPSEAPATSEATAVVLPPTFGKMNVGASTDVFAGGRKRVNHYALPSTGSVTKLTIYLAPTGKAGQQVMKGIIYSDQAGAPNALLGVTEQLTFHSTNAAGWYEMNFAAPVKLAPGTYWIGEITGSTANVAGFRYDSVAGSRDFNAQAYRSVPSNPFGAVSIDAEQTSLYATYIPG